MNDFIEAVFVVTVIAVISIVLYTFIAFDVECVIDFNTGKQDCYWTSK